MQEWAGEGGLSELQPYPFPKSPEPALLRFLLSWLSPCHPSSHVPAWISFTMDSS